MKRKIIDRLLLLCTAIGGLLIVASIDIGLSKLGITEIWRLFTLFAILLFGISLYGVLDFLKEEKIKRKKHMYILSTLGFYFIFMNLMIILDRLNIIPMIYLIGRGYRFVLTGQVYLAILLFILVYIAEKFEKNNS